MFNLGTTNSVGYNGISQLSDIRCAPQYESGIERPLSSPSGKLRAFIHNETQSKSSPAQRDAQSRRPSHPRLDSPSIGDDVYTFKDSDPHLNNIHHNSRIKKPPIADNKIDAIVKKSPEKMLQRSPKDTKQMNGFDPNRNDFGLPLLNGVHTVKVDLKNASMRTPVKVTVRQNKDLFGNFSFGDFGKFPSDHYDKEVNDTKNSITRYSVNPLETMLGSAYHEPKLHETEIKKEADTWDVEGSVTTPLFSTSSKFTSSPAPRKLPSGKPLALSSRARRGRGPALHEALQRISPQDSNRQWCAPTTPHFECVPLDNKQFEEKNDNCVQAWMDGIGGSEPSLGRAERLAARRAALRRRTTQLCRYTSCLHSSYSLHHSVKMQIKREKWDKTESSSVAAPTLDKLLAARGYTTLLSAADRKKIRSGCKLVGSGSCVSPGCEEVAMACAAYCLRHITTSPNQRLFTRCTAKFSDNTQCLMPVVNVTNHLPLCDEHAWKRDNYNKICQESKPKRAPRKRPKPSAMIRPQKRNRKRRRPPPPAALYQAAPNQGSASSGCEESAEEAGMGLSEEFIGAATSQHIDEEVVAQVLALQEEETPAPSQDPNIDLSTVFNDFFAAEQNEGYVPTREETEELERALEAVNQDVKSLEKLTASQGSALLLDALLDERALAETLASLPDVFSPSPNCTA